MKVAAPQSGEPVVLIFALESTIRAIEAQRLETLAAKTYVQSG
jgi:hypothetical protein